MAKAIELKFESGIVSYRYEDKRTAHLSEEEREATCFFTKEFHTLGELLQLVSSEYLNPICIQKGYEKLWVESIQLFAKDHEGKIHVETLLTLKDGHAVELQVAS
ncbi:hypothetical protein [Caldibacillus debilis]|uniref:Uncharacterized protein n=1 Tax=Caldibacillus debilis GB1 TaxID=1339248 RepID=A0A420VEG0_9BACI|nr:hypothetical protein [Caldibacillus debilis]RKO61743.1 hypothetical protein Cdeb_01214 [Caldibacillus debilis GB1]